MTLPCWRRTLGGWPDLKSIRRGCYRQVHRRWSAPSCHSKVVPRQPPGRALQCPPSMGSTKMAETVYKVVELIGTSTESWEKAAKAAVERASETLRDLRIAESSSRMARS